MIYHRRMPCQQNLLELATLPLDIYSTLHVIWYMMMMLMMMMQLYEWVCVCISVCFLSLKRCSRPCWHRRWYRSDWQTTGLPSCQSSGTWCATTSEADDDDATDSDDSEVDGCWCRLLSSPSRRWTTTMIRLERCMCWAVHVSLVSSLCLCCGWCGWLSSYCCCCCCRWCYGCCRDCCCCCCCCCCCQMRLLSDRHRSSCSGTTSHL